ncbi:hypothetical protein ACEPAF_1592 [Sanghuangporus sanghuang]
MHPSCSKKLTEKAKAAQDVETPKKKPKVRRGPGQPCKDNEALATPEAPQKSSRKKKGKGPLKKLHNSDDTSDLDDNSDDNYQLDEDLSINDVVQVANKTGPDQTT